MAKISKFNLELIKEIENELKYEWVHLHKYAKMDDEAMCEYYQGKFVALLDLIESRSGLGYASMIIAVSNEASRSWEVN